MNRSFETFDHTADIGIRARAERIHELFEEMAKALFSVLVDLKTVTCRRTVKLKVNCRSRSVIVPIPLQSPPKSLPGLTGQSGLDSPVKPATKASADRPGNDKKCKVPKRLHGSKRAVPSSPYEELMLAWLKELLFIFETKRLVFSDFHVSKITPENLTAEAKGEPLNPAKHSLGREVKAVTLHQFKVEQKTSGYLTEAILDI